jgi:hypothetical protein
MSCGVYGKMEVDITEALEERLSILSSDFYTVYSDDEIPDFKVLEKEMGDGETRIYIKKMDGNIVIIRMVGDELEINSELCVDNSILDVINVIEEMEREKI